MDKIEFDATVIGIDSKMPRSNPPNSMWLRIDGLPVSEDHDGDKALLLDDTRKAFGLESRIGDRLKITVERV